MRRKGNNEAEEGGGEGGEGGGGGGEGGRGIMKQQQLIAEVAGRA